MKLKKLNLFFIVFAVFLAVVSRLIPHAPNFTPIFAISIWLMIYMSRKFIFLPLVVMFLSDYFIGFYDVRLMIFVYFSIILISLLGVILKKDKSFYKVLGVSIFGSFIFYFVSNFGVWYLSSWYSKDISGILNCYVMALPFLKNALVSDVFYLTTLVFTTEFVLNGGVLRVKNYLRDFFKNYKKAII